MKKNQKIKTVRKNFEIHRLTSLKFLNSPTYGGLKQKKFQPFRSPEVLTIFPEGRTNLNIK
jgi:hypothetical protein